MKLKLDSINNVTCRMILILNKSKSIHILKIAKDLDVTYSYISITINMLIKEKIIIKQKVGRRCNIYLTDKGLKIQEKLFKLKDIINE